MSSEWLIKFIWWIVYFHPFVILSGSEEPIRVPKRTIIVRMYNRCFVPQHDKKETFPLQGAKAPKLYPALLQASIAFGKAYSRRLKAFRLS